MSAVVTLSGQPVIQQALDCSPTAACAMVRVILTAPVLQKYVKYNLDSRCLLLPNENIVEISIEEPVLNSCCIVDLSFNALMDGKHIFRLHPDLWWLNLRHNNISSLSDLMMPPCIGLLDLSENALPSIVSNLACIEKINILKLNLYIPSSLTSREMKRGASPSGMFAFTQKYKKSRQSVLPYLPNVWCLDNDFVCADERQQATQLIMTAGGSMPLSKVTATYVGYSTAPVNSRAKRLLHAINNLPTKVALSEQYKLDILLEEYLEQMLVQKEHPSPPQVEVDLLRLLELPPRVRLDLCALLAAIIMHPLDERMVSTGLRRLLLPLLPKEHIAALPMLPIYVLSALVSQLVQVMRREVEELDFVGYLTPKILCGPATAPHTSSYASSYSSYKNFSFLRPLKEYLAAPLQEIVQSGRRHLRKDADMTALRAASASYSDEEREMLRCLTARVVYTRATSGGSASPELASIFRHAAIYIRDSLFSFDSSSVTSARSHLQLLKNSCVARKWVDALRPLAYSAGLHDDFADAVLPCKPATGVLARVPPFLLADNASEDDEKRKCRERGVYRPGDSVFSDNLSATSSPQERSPNASPQRPALPSPQGSPLQARASPEMTAYPKIIVLPFEKKRFLSQWRSPSRPPPSPTSRVGSSAGSRAPFDASALEALDAYKEVEPLPPCFGNVSRDDEALVEEVFIGVMGTEVKIIPESDRIDEVCLFVSAQRKTLNPSKIHRPITWRRPLTRAGACWRKWALCATRALQCTIPRTKHYW